MDIGRPSSIHEQNASTYIQDLSGNIHEVEYTNTNGLAFFQGDILLGTIEELGASYQEGYNMNTSVKVHMKYEVHDRHKRSIAIKNKRYRWPKNIIPYIFDNSVAGETKSMMLDAMNHWKANTPFNFIELNDKNKHNYSDYVSVEYSENCLSEVGRVGGKQRLLGISKKGCGYGSVIHEIGHLVGFWHEHTRSDRDAYIKIVWNNIIAREASELKKHNLGAEILGHYDYNSAKKMDLVKEIY